MPDTRRRASGYLSLAGTCSDSLQALEILHKQQIDLVFLDIHLPGLKGLDFLRTLQKPPAVIITTAYHQYALQGYELNVIDYLLKPIEFRRFVEAVNKVERRHPVSETITIYADRKNVVIPVQDIVYVESQKEYLSIQTIDKSYLTKYSLVKLEQELDATRFLRVHRSFIVSLAHIKAYNQTEIDVKGKTLPVGGNYQEMVSMKLKARVSAKLS